MLWSKMALVLAVMFTALCGVYSASLPGLGPLAALDSKMDSLAMPSALTNILTAKGNTLKELSDKVKSSVQERTGDALESTLDALNTEQGQRSMLDRTLGVLDSTLDTISDKVRRSVLNSTLAALDRTLASDEAKGRILDRTEDARDSTGALDSTLDAISSESRRGVLNSTLTALSTDKVQSKMLDRTLDALDSTGALESTLDALGSVKRRRSVLNSTLTGLSSLLDVDKVQSRMLDRTLDALDSGVLDSTLDAIGSDKVRRSVLDSTLTTLGSTLDVDKVQSRMLDRTLDALDSGVLDSTLDAIGSEKVRRSVLDSTLTTLGSTLDIDKVQSRMLDRTLDALYSGVLDSSLDAIGSDKVRRNVLNSTLAEISRTVDLDKAPSTVLDSAIDSALDAIGSEVRSSVDSNLHGLEKGERSALDPGVLDGTLDVLDSTLAGLGSEKVRRSVLDDMKRLLDSQITAFIEDGVKRIAGILKSQLKPKSIKLPPLIQEEKKKNPEFSSSREAESQNSELIKVLTDGSLQDSADVALRNAVDELLQEDEDRTKEEGEIDSGEVLDNTGLFQQNVNLSRNHSDDIVNEEINIDTATQKADTDVMNGQKVNSNYNKDKSHVLIEDSPMISKNRKEDEGVENILDIDEILKANAKDFNDSLRKQNEDSGKDVSHELKIEQIVNGNHDPEEHPNSNDKSSKTEKHQIDTYEKEQNIHGSDNYINNIDIDENMLQTGESSSNYHDEHKDHNKHDTESSTLSTTKRSNIHHIIATPIANNKKTLKDAEDHNQQYYSGAGHYKNNHPNNRKRVDSHKIIYFPGDNGNFHDTNDLIETDVNENKFDKITEKNKINKNDHTHHDENHNNHKRKHNKYHHDKSNDHKNSDHDTNVEQNANKEQHHVENANEHVLDISLNSLLLGSRDRHPQEYNNLISSESDSDDSLMERENKKQTKKQESNVTKNIKDYPKKELNFSDKIMNGTGVKINDMEENSYVDDTEKDDSNEIMRVTKDKNHKTGDNIAQKPSNKHTENDNASEDNLSETDGKYNTYSEEDHKTEKNNEIHDNTTPNIKETVTDGNISAVEDKMVVNKEINNGSNHQHRCNDKKHHRHHHDKSDESHESAESNQIRNFIPNKETIKSYTLTLTYTTEQ